MRTIVTRLSLLIALVWVLGQLVVMEGGPEVPHPTPTPTPRPTPPAPAELQQLPRLARVDCPQYRPYKSTLWEYPGLDPGPKSSESIGVLGHDVAYVSDCSVVEITRYAWSETDKIFYLFVHSAEGAGWIGIDLMDLAEVPESPPPTVTAK